MHREANRLGVNRVHLESAQSMRPPLLPLPAPQKNPHVPNQPIIQIINHHFVSRVREGRFLETDSQLLINIGVDIPSKWRHLLQLLMK